MISHPLQPHGNHDQGLRLSAEGSAGGRQRCGQARDPLEPGGSLHGESLLQRER